MMQRLTVTATSPDRSVTVTASGTPAEVSVRIAAGSLADHTDADMERQLEGAARIAMMGYRKGAHEAWRRAAGVADDA